MDKKNHALEVEFGMRATDLNPREVTQALGVVPTRMFSRGEIVGGSRVAKPFGLWAVGSRDLVQSGNLEDHIEAVLCRIESAPAVLKKYLVDSDYYVAVSIWWVLSDDQSGFTLSQSMLRRLSVVCNELNVYTPCAP